MMSSLSDSHSTRAETSRTRPVTSTAMTLTGMATVRPVRMAVLMISVSCARRGGWGSADQVLADPSSTRTCQPRPWLLTAPTCQVCTLPWGHLHPCTGRCVHPASHLLRCSARLVFCSSFHGLPPTAAKTQPFPMPSHLLSMPSVLPRTPPRKVQRICLAIQGAPGLAPTHHSSLITPMPSF